MCDEPEGDMKDYFGEGVREKVGYRDSPHPILDTLCDGEEEGGIWKLMFI